MPLQKASFEHMGMEESDSMVPWSTAPGAPRPMLAPQPCDGRTPEEREELFVWGIWASGAPLEPLKP